MGFGPAPLPGSRHTPIAIDVCRDHIDVAQLTRRGRGRWRVRFALSIRRTPVQQEPGTVAELSDADLDQIGRVLELREAIGRRVALVAPPESTPVELLELPARGPGVPVEALARAEMTRIARFDESASLQLAMWDVPAPVGRRDGESRPGTSAYAAAIAEQAVAPLARRLADRGWPVHWVIPAPVAAARLAAEADDALAAVVHVGRDRAALSIARAGAAIYHRELPDHGLDLLSLGLANALGIDAGIAVEAVIDGGVALDGASTASRVATQFAEALASEVEASFEFAARRYGGLDVRRLILAGPGVAVEGLAAWLGKQFEIDEANPDRQGRLGRCMGAAIAAHALGRDGCLLPAEQRTEARRDRAVGRWAVAAATTAVVGGVVGGSALAATTMTSRTAVDGRLAGIGREQARVDAQLAATLASLAVERRAAGFEQKLLDQPEYAAALELLNGCLGDSTTLRDLSLQNAAGNATATAAPVAFRRVRIVGEAADTRALTAIAARIRAIDVFGQVEILRATRADEAGRVAFEIVFNVVAPPPPTTTTTTARADRGRQSR